MINAFSSNLDELAFAQYTVLLACRGTSTHSDTTSSIPANHTPLPPLHPSLPPISVAPLSTAPPVPTPPAKVNYSLLIPVATTSSTISANALRPEIQEHLLYRAGYVPLSALTNCASREFAANPGTLEKRWILILTEFIPSFSSSIGILDNLRCGFNA